MPVLRLSRIPRFPDPAATGTVAIRTTPADAYRVVSDPPVMIRLAEEAHRARWLANNTNIGTTLQRLKHHLESALPSVADGSQRSDRPVG
ncbi:hypothetical protein [Streptomyces bugieae]|uniref:Uncharacterized protein n=1 Tax=Streptomyces bugieae TaxID=3098223 RepID=A0ABU7NG21_9ACTN|nr:hypothetical protein [Streptomyces sp. DSM 41528]